MLVVVVVGIVVVNIVVDELFESGSSEFAKLVLNDDHSSVDSKLVSEFMLTLSALEKEAVLINLLLLSMVNVLDMINSEKLENPFSNCVAFEMSPSLSDVLSVSYSDVSDTDT